MYSFEKMDDLHQNLYTHSKNDGVFILDKRGNITFANEKAEEIYQLEKELKKMVSRKSTNLVKGNKEISLYPIYEDNKLKLFLGVMRDREEIMKMVQTVAKAYEGMKIFKEDIAHYFFNPISIAKGYLQLAMDGEENVENKFKMEKVKTAIERIEAVVRNIVMNGRISE